jgi:hypothetical protein
MGILNGGPPRRDRRSGRRVRPRGHGLREASTACAGAGGGLSRATSAPAEQEPRAMPTDAPWPADATVAVLFDAHAHLHDAFDAGGLLDAVARAVAAEAAARGLAPAVGAICITDMAGVDGWRRLRDAPPPGWVATPAEDGLSLVATAPGRPPIIVIAGRQAATAEGLEVSALGFREALPDGLPLAETIDRVRAADGLPVLPWGVGKWMGRRGALVRATVADRARFPVLGVGDSGARAAFWPVSPLIAEAAALGRPVLSGSDPLPLAGHADRAGGFGVIVKTVLSAARPFESLRAAAFAPGAVLAPFGRPEQLGRFLVAQAAMQARKRFGGGAFSRGAARAP